MGEQLEAYLNQARSLAALVAAEADGVAARTRLLLSMEEAYGIRQIIITGSGDSYFAAMAAATSIRAWTGLPTTAMVSMEASRYIDHGRPPLAGRNRGLLVISISNSGEAARLVEATHRLRRLGAITLAITADKASRLGQAAEKHLEIPIPAAMPAPGTRTYVASLIGIYHIGIRIAEMLMCMTMDHAEALRRELKNTHVALLEAVKASEPIAAELAKKWASASRMDCLGSGPSLASAHYAAAKLVEAVGIHATPQDAEEFHHLNYFVDDPQDVPTILFAPSSALSHARSLELVDALDQLGRPKLIVTDDSAYCGSQDALILPAVSEAFSPIVHTVPAALLAAHLADLRQVPHYRGHTGPWRGAQNAGLVRNSKIELPK
ncbi:SIS domain-containing protein [Rhizobium leguminosarum]|uniref:SIS domain-containing protein n=1 Tax=Rhizobium leguminosarum TaxID=384 RepID=UPI0004065334|nr:SIS domain-containing protein [Rhizobium leguminosarum]UIJ83208.1 SIS domain-containing protein [Rhizobium leguminosarum]